VTDPSPWEDLDGLNEGIPPDPTRSKDRPRGASGVSPWTQADKFQGTLIALPASLGSTAFFAIAALIMIINGRIAFLVFGAASAFFAVWWLVRCIYIVVQWVRFR